MTDPAYVLGDPCSQCGRTDWITSVILDRKRVCGGCLGITPEHANPRPELPAKPVKVRKR